MKVALTGHRPQRLELPENIRDVQWSKIEMLLILAIDNLYNHSVKRGEELTAYCGMASGSDIKFGHILSVMKYFPCYNNIKLSCVLPYKDYNVSNQYYDPIKEMADEWIELADEFYKGCDDARDQYMVDNCDVLIAIWDGIKSGGVWSTIRKAQKAGKQIIYCPIEILKRE